MPDIWFDVDAALAEVPVNIMPLVDDTDFKTIEDGPVAYNASGMDLRWNFVTPDGSYTSTAVTPTTSGTYDWAHQGDGMYSIEIPASGGASINNDTEGFGWFSGRITGILPFRGPICGFRASGLNDALVESAYSTTRGLAGTALPAAAADAAGGLPISDAGGLDIDTILGRITGNVALASVLGALTDSASTGDPGTSTTTISFLKQLINVLIGTAGVATFPSAAAPGNAVSLAEIIRAIYDDTNELQTDDYPTTLAAIKAQTDKLAGLVIAAGTIGDTGNDTTHVHLPAFTYGDDEINGYMVVLYDASADEYHHREVEDWVNSSKLATVATLPFTPQDSTDTYWLLGTLGSASLTGGDATEAKQDAIIALIGTPTNTDLAGDLADIEGKVDDLETRLGTPLDLGSGATVAANLADIEGFVDNLPSDPADQSAVEAAIATAQNAILAVVGALADAAADGDPTTGETLMQYTKQLVNVLVGSAGIVSFPSEAAPGNGVSLAEVIRAIHADTNTTLQGELDGIQADTEDIQSKIGTVSNLGSGATVGANLLDILSTASSILGQTSGIADIPTNSELATALAAADDAVLAAIAALNDLSAAEVNAEVVDVLRTDTIPDSLAADGAQPTIAQAIYEILQFLEERSVSGTTLTVKKRDGSTSLMTFTLSDATDPMSITRST